MISTRARYALHGACFLALLPGETTPFPRLFSYLGAWSGHETLSRSYVGKIFQDLARGGIVRSVPGRKGGYRLARPASQVTLLDVVQVVDPLPSNDCCLLAVGDCPVRSACGVVSVLDEAQAAFVRVLSGMTLEKLARRMPLPGGTARLKKSSARG
jgi:Rrf2 family protein